MKRRWRALRDALNGPQDLGRSPGFWGVFIAATIGLLLYPASGSSFGLSSLVSFLLYVPMALGLGLLWGYGGILSFGQSAFFGIAGYISGLVAGNLTGTPAGTIVALVAAIAAAALAASIFGYFLFYGQVSGWIIPLLCLVLTLILATFMGQTAGYQWRVGQVLLGGYNGMTNIPSLRAGAIEFGGTSTALYYLVVVVTLLLYLGLRVFVNSRYGHVLVAVRDDPERTRMLGHNVDFIQVQVFALAAALAGLSGVLYASWGNYMNPSTMDLLAATLPVIWTAVGGRRSLLAVVLSTVALRALADSLAVSGSQYAFLVMGALLLATMLFFPGGIIVSVARAWRRPSRTRPGAREAVEPKGKGEVA